MSQRSLGAAHRGTTAFLVQRLSSIYLGGFLVYFLIFFIANPIQNFASWTNYFSGGAVRLAWAIFIASLLAHIWVGLRSIYMDYLHPTALRFTVSFITAVILIALAFWAALILLRGFV